MVCRDFNEILGLNEKWRGKNKPEKWMNDFREVINSCALRDLSYRALNTLGATIVRGGVCK